jgi:hypothetical protein
MIKIIFFEGLPGSGKTTMTKHLEDKYPFCIRIGEVIDSLGKEIPLEKHFGKNSNFFVKSDINKLKISKNSKNKIILIDRGFLSTLSHGFTRKIENKEKDFDFILKQFDKKLDFKNMELYYIFLKNTPKTSLRRSKHPPEDIWGTEENLIKTELFYKIYFLFRKNVFVINSDKLPLAECKRRCEKIVLNIKKSIY